MKAGRKLPQFIKKPLAEKYLKKHVNRLQSQNKRYVRVKINDIWYDLDLWTYVGFTFYNLKSYEPKTVKVLKKVLKSDMIVVDVGASFGILSFIMSKLVGQEGKVYCFEPSFYMFKRLQNGIKLNYFTNIVPEKLALSNSNRTDTVITKRFGVIGDESKNTETEKVNFIRLDDYWKNIPYIDFIKIDTDGHEPEVIMGAEKCIEKNHPMMIIEFRKETVDQLINLLSPKYNFYDENMRVYSNEKLIKKSNKGTINVVVM